MNAIKFLVAMTMVLISAVANAGGFTIVAPFNHGRGMVILNHQEPQPVPLHCERGILVRKNPSGEPTCLYRITVNVNGEQQQATIEETPSTGFRGNNFNGGVNGCVPRPQIYGQYNQPQCW